MFLLCHGEHLGLCFTFVLCTFPCLCGLPGLLALLFLLMHLPLLHEPLCAALLIILVLAAVLDSALNLVC